MRITVRFSDVIGPDLAAKAREARNLAPVLDAVGQHVVGIAKRSFNDQSLRVAPWPQKKRPNGQPLLKLTGNLWQSLRVISAGATKVTVGSDRPYAAIHQLGGTIRRPEMRPTNKKALYWPGAAHPVKRVKAATIAIPARPYFPFDASGNLGRSAAESVFATARAKLNRMFGVA
jgi:phage gpG-like protein